MKKKLVDESLRKECFRVGEAPGGRSESPLFGRAGKEDILDPTNETMFRWLVAEVKKKKSRDGQTRGGHFPRTRQNLRGV